MRRITMMDTFVFSITPWLLMSPVIILEIILLLILIHFRKHRTDYLRLTFHRFIFYRYVSDINVQ